jgi:hypothetical protein
MMNEEEILLDSEDALATFRAAVPAFADYDSEENLVTMAQWFGENCGGLQAGRTLGAWQLAFQNCLAAGTLSLNPDSAEARRIREAEEQAPRLQVQALRARWDAMSAAEAARFYRDQDDATRKLINSF